MSRRVKGFDSDETKMALPTTKSQRNYNTSEQIHDADFTPQLRPSEKKPLNSVNDTTDLRMIELLRSVSNVAVIVYCFVEQGFSC